MKNGSKKRRVWTADQVRELKSLARKKTPAGKIAKSLKRTEGEARQRRSPLDYRSIRVRNDLKLVSATLPTSPATPVRGALIALPSVDFIQGLLC
jgi:hypothetical protein